MGTPQAQKLLSDTLAADSDDDFVLPEPMPQWLDQAQKGKAGSKAAAMAAFPGNEQLRLQYMGKLGPNEFLLRLAKDSGAEAPAEFARLLISQTSVRARVTDVTRSWSGTRIAWQPANGCARTIAKPQPSTRRRP